MGVQIPSNLDLASFFPEGSPEGQLLADLLTSLRKYATDIHRERVRKSIKELQQKGYKHGGQRPDRLPREVLELISKSRRNGMTQREIAALLNERGYLSSRGGIWRLNTVQYALARIEAGTYRTNLGDDDTIIEHYERGPKNPWVKTSSPWVSP